MLKKILLVLVAAVLALVVVVTMQPTDYHVERSVVVDAPAEAVWSEITDFNKWPAWNAWHKSNPDQKDTITGEPNTVGHKDAWVGEQTGEGSMTLTKLDEPKRMDMRLDFITPMEGTADAYFTIDPEGDRVKVTWAMDGKNEGFVAKFFGMVMDMDEMVGGMYEKGLADLKGVAETNAKKMAEEKAAAEAKAAEEAKAAAEAAAAAEAEGAAEGEEGSE